MAHRARAVPEGPADVCPPPGHPRMWLGAEDSRDPGHHCWASRGGQPEEAEWLGRFQVMPHTGLPSGPLLGPAPKHRGSVSRAQPWLSLLPPASVCPVGDPGWSLPRLCVSLPSMLCMCCLFGPSASIFFHSAPGLPLPSALPPPLCSLSRPTPAIIFSSVPPRSHFLPAFPPLGFIHQLFHHVAKEKKKGGGSPPTKKPKQKLILSVFRSAASSWWPVCPCGLQPARPPYPSAVCPARPPACPPCPSCQRHGVQCLGVW